jgi:hypothetical protein
LAKGIAGWKKNNNMSIKKNTTDFSTFYKGKFSKTTSPVEHFLTKNKYYYF